MKKQIIAFLFVALFASLLFFPQMSRHTDVKISVTAPQRQFNQITFDIPKPPPPGGDAVILPMPENIG